MTVGDRIRQRRIELGLSQSELAAKMGYSGKSTISKAESYGDGVTTTKVSKFAKALDTSVEWLMGWDDTHLEFDYDPKDEEEELLALWRVAPEHIKDSVMILLQSSLKKDL